MAKHRRIHKFKIRKELTKKYTKQNRKLILLDNKHQDKYKQNKKHFPFNHRVRNLTQTQFSTQELHLLNKGLQYNLHYKQKSWIKTLALEAETALCHLDINEQEQMRHLVANNLKHLIKNQSWNSKNTKYEWNIIKSIKQKLLDNNSIMTQADKGKTIVITHKQEYDQYIDTFINNNCLKIPPVHIKDL
jgi:hypothetical protein